MYSVLDKWTDLDKENIVDFTSVDGVVTQARLNGVPVGGGGGQTTLNFTDDSGEGTSLDLYVYSTDDDNTQVVFASITPLPSISIPFMASNNDFIVALVKDPNILSISGEYETITLSGSEYYQINGNVTLKIKAWEP